MDYYFYCLETVDDAAKHGVVGSADGGKMRKPSFIDALVLASRSCSFIVWWFFDRFGIFANRGYHLYTVDQNGRMVHQSVVLPKFFRFPFMDDGDLMIADTWTCPDFRGLGLATHAVLNIVDQLSMPTRKFWYIVERDNAASIKVVEKSGFRKRGTGVLKKRFGLGQVGRFQMNEIVSNASVKTKE